jgi:hypothetical protein
MPTLEAALAETASYTVAETLSTFEAHIDPDWIEQALQATGTATLRRRRLPAEQVVWLVLGMALMRDRPMLEVVSKLDLALPGRGGETTVAPSTVSQARQRLGAKPLKWLFDKCAQAWAVKSAADHRWRGLSVFALDGSTLRVADSEENREHFGLASGGPRGDSAYPLVRLVTLITARSHLIAAACFGPYGQSEHAYATQLWSEIPAESVTLLDRNFLVARILVGLQTAANRHWLLRAKVNTRWRVTKKLGPDDLLVELDVSQAARKQDPSLPATFQARAMSYQIDKRKPKQWLLTSLLDAALYPHAELVALYHERWEIELAYDEIKTHQLDRQETIRSRSVDGVEQELWGILLTYNLVRLEMQRIAQEAAVDPSRISFVTAMRFIRDEWAWCAVASPGSIPHKLRRMRADILEFVLPPRRTKRSYPRAVKIKMSNYPKKQRPVAKRRAVK